MKKFNAFLITILFFTGCSALVHVRNNMNPVVMYRGEEKSDKEISLISGQCYMPHLGKYVEINIDSVDGKPTFTFWDMNGAAFRIYVLPGEHFLALRTRIGNNLILGTSESNYYPIRVEASRAYQINYKLFTDSSEEIYIKYSFDDIGTITDYWNYYKMNPDVVDGSPVPQILK